jgi:probable HAF family extracellular repeat protein
MKDLGALGTGIFSSASGINRAGKVVGWSAKGGKNHAVSWKNGVIKDLGTDGRLSSVATAINTAGQITGSVGPFPDAQGEELEMSDPFIYLNEVFTLFGTGQLSSSSNAINKDGTVAGYDSEANDENAFERAWVKRPGSSAAYLPTLVQGHSQAWGINDFGNIVGIGPAQSGSGHAMLWRHQ